MEQAIIIHCAVKESSCRKFLEVIKGWGDELFQLHGEPRIIDDVVLVDVEMKIVNLWELLKSNMVDKVGNDNFSMVFTLPGLPKGDIVGDLKSKDDKPYFELKLSLDYNYDTSGSIILPDSDSYFPKIREFVVKTEKGYVYFDPEEGIKFGDIERAMTLPELRFWDIYDNLSTDLKYSHECENVEYEVKNQLPFTDSKHDEIGKIFKTYGRYPAYTGVPATINEGEKITIEEYLDIEGLYRIEADHTRNGGYINSEDLIDLITPKNEVQKDED